MAQTLYNDDCLKVLKSIKDKSIDLIVTDPPYEIDTKGGGSINKVKHMVDTMCELRENKIDKGYSFSEVHAELVRIMKNINIYIWCNKIQIPNTACISEKVVTATLVQQMKDMKMQKLFISHLLIRKTRNSIIILQLNLLT